MERSEKQSEEERDLESLAKEVGADVAYYRAVEVARRKKEPIPVQ